MIFFNDVSVHTPVEHTHAAIAAIRHFGQNPKEARPLESFRMPAVEPFSAFLRRTETR
jgi:hypothetical protein